MRSFCVSWLPFSSTLYTSFADGGRCPILLGLLFSFVFTTKTIPHSGSPLQNRNSQLLSISVHGTVSDARFNHPFGISIYPTATSTEDLYAMSVIGIMDDGETMDRVILANACPTLSLSYILALLEDAVSEFGKNRIFSNFIIGLGETVVCGHGRTVSIAGRREGGVKKKVFSPFRTMLGQASRRSSRCGQQRGTR
jgi:hypothetical protein